MFIKLSICILVLAIRIVFTTTLGPTNWIYIAEIVQPNIIPYTTMVNWIVVAIILTLFPIVKYWLNGNSQWIFMMFGIYSLIAYFVDRVILI